MERKSLMSAKRLKSVGSYTEAEILSVLGEFTDAEKQQLHGISQKMIAKLRNVDTTQVDRPKKKAKFQVVTKMQRLANIIPKIEQAVDKYARSDTVEVWKIKFHVGVDYEKKSLDQIKELHEMMIESGVSAEQTKLIIYAERGRLYDTLKFSNTWSRRWDELCIQLNICPKTASRCIDFWRIVSAFPRLLICQLSLETIVSLYKELFDHFNANPNLADKLKQPLRESYIKAGMRLRSTRMPSGGEPPNELLSEGADWAPAWDIADEIIHNREQAKTELDFEEATEDEDDD